MPDPKTPTGAPGQFRTGRGNAQPALPPGEEGALDPTITPHLLSLVSRVNALEGGFASERQELLRLRGDNEVIRSKITNASNLIETWANEHIVGFGTGEAPGLEAGLAILKGI